MLNLSRDGQNRPVRSRESLKSSLEKVNGPIFIFVCNRKELNGNCIVIREATKVG